ncbi:MAG: ethanolamine ammonia-lyase subunit EutC [Corynebacterium sp.]|nr:ethanolamine ammonia-lyase subunit EutC [Corynebacterium sp.]
MDETTTVAWGDIPSLSATNTKAIVPTPSAQLSVAALQELSPARIALGQCGAGLPTSARTQLLEDHGQARDSVHSQAQWDVVATALTKLGYGSQFREVSSQAGSRVEYLTRPDLGRLPHSVAHIHPQPEARIGIVLADGLSPQAVHMHGPQLIDALFRLNPGQYHIDEPVFAHQARVALGDHIAAAAQWDVVIMIIGERPGMSVPSSLGLYLTYKAQPGSTDEQRNCISNVHPPEGTDYEAAAAIAWDLIEQFYYKQKSGFEIKAKEAQMLLAKYTSEIQA